LNNILFTYFTGIPDKNVGGGNRIIAEIISNFNSEDYNFYFLSDYFKSFIRVNRFNYETSTNPIPIKKKYGAKIFRKNSFYRNLTFSQAYQNYYLNRICKKFESIKSEEFNVIHSHDTLSSGIFRSVQNSKKILTIQSKGSLCADLGEKFYNKNKRKKWIQKFQEYEFNNFLNADVVTFPSIAAKDLFLKDLNIPDRYSKKIKIIYNGADVNFINEIKPSDVLSKYNVGAGNYDFIIINVASHLKLKNIDKILQVIDFLKLQSNTNPLLINVGIGPLTNLLIQMTRKLNLVDNVKFLGQVSNMDIIRMMKSSDVYISLGERVIFDFVVLEALASGIPVVASKEGGNNEIIKDGENGFLVNIRNIPDISKKIVKCVGEKFKHKGISLESKFTISNMVLEYKKLYNE